MERVGAPVRTSWIGGVLGDLIASAENGPHYEVELAAAPVRFTVKGTSLRLLDALASDLAPYLIRAPSGHRKGGDEVWVMSDTASIGWMQSAWIDLCRGSAEHDDLLRRGELRAIPVRTCEDQSDAYLLRIDRRPRGSYAVLPDDSRCSSLALLRIVRAIAMRTLLETGWVPLHAACVTARGGAVGLIGGHGGGKTTTMIGLLTAGVGDSALGLLSNDVLFVKEMRGDLWARGLPVAVAIRLPTVRLFPALGRLADRASDIHPTNRTADLMSECGDVRLLVPPQRLAEALDVKVVPMARLTCVVEVAYRHDLKRSRLTLLPGEHAAAMLASAYLQEWFRDQEYEGGRLRLRPESLQLAHRRQLARWADRLRPFRFEPVRQIERAVLQRLTVLAVEGKR